MKKVFTTIVSLLKKFFLSLGIHLHVGICVGRDSDNEETENDLKCEEHEEEK